MRGDDRSAGFIAERHAGENAILAAAAALAGVFDALGDGPADATEVARRAALDPRAVSIVLPALVDAGYLREERDGFVPTGKARDAFLGDAPEGGYRLWLHHLRSWIRLESVLREGGPAEPPGEGDGEDEEEGRRRFMEAMAAQPDERARRVAGLLRSRAPEARTALDLGGGPGLYARALVAEGFRVTLVDLPPVVELVRTEYGLAGEPEIELRPGDFLADPLPEGPFDAVLLSNVTHSHSPEENAALLRRVRQVTAPGAVVGIHDMVRGRSTLAARFAMTMLLRSEAGNTYTGDAYRRWLQEAGFSRIEVEDVEPERQLITAEVV